MQALSVHPKDRFQTMQAFKNALPPMPVIKTPPAEQQHSQQNSQQHSQQNSVPNIQNTGTNASPLPSSGSLSKWALWLIIAGAVSSVVLIIAVIAALAS